MPVLRAPAIINCRVCASRRLMFVLSLGDQYVSDFITSSGEHPKAPLELVKCSNCGLVQLRHTIPRDSLYRHYWYRSGISGTMREALADITLKACRIVKPLPGSIVMDIGCNDGTLLRSYPKIGLMMQEKTLGGYSTIFSRRKPTKQNLATDMSELLRA